MIKNKFLSLFLVGFMLSGFQGAAFARLTNQTNETNPDQWSCCKSGSEVAVDASGNILPTTASNQNLGSSTLPWLSIFTGSLTTTGVIHHTAQSVTLSSNTVITPSSSFAIVTSSGGAITWSGTSNVSITTTAASNGDPFSIMSSTNVAITLTDSSTLQLSTTSTSNSRVFKVPGDNISLRFLNGVWYEVSFSTGHE